MAKLFKVSQEATRKWLEDESMPRMTKLSEIARYFGVDVHWLTTGDGGKYPLSANGAPKDPPLTPNEQSMLRLFRELPPLQQALAIDLVGCIVRASQPTPPEPSGLVVDE